MIYFHYINIIYIINIYHDIINIIHSNDSFKNGFIQKRPGPISIRRFNQLWVKSWTLSWLTLWWKTLSFWFQNSWIVLVQSSLSRLTLGFTTMRSHDHWSSEIWNYDSPWQQHPTKRHLCTLSQRISLILNHCYCIISEVKTQGGGGGGTWQQLKMKYKNTIQSR